MAALELLRPTFFPPALTALPDTWLPTAFFLFQPLGVAVSAGLGTSPSWRPGACGLEVRPVLPDAGRPYGPLVQQDSSRFAPRFLRHMALEARTQLC